MNIFKLFEWGFFSIHLSSNLFSFYFTVAYEVFHKQHLLIIMVMLSFVDSYLYG